MRTLNAPKRATRSRRLARGADFFRRKLLADDQELRGGRSGDHRRVLQFEARHANRADEAGELNLRKARRTHLA